MRLTTLERGFVALLFLIPLLLTIGCLKDNQRRDRQQQYAATSQKQGATTSLHSAIASGEHQSKGRTAEQREEEKTEIDRRVANATDELAAYTRGLFWATLLLAAGTAVLVIYAIKQSGDAVQSSKAAVQAAQAAERSVECSRDALVQGQRAWIIVDAEIGGDGITIDDIRVTIPISLKYRNIGNAIALSVTPFAEVFPGGEFGPSIVEWRAFIAGATSRRGHLSMYLIPGATMPGEDDPTKITISSGIFKFTETRFDRIMQAEDLKLFVGGCVTYTFPTDMGTVHHTGFFLHVNGMNGKTLSSKRSHIPANEIALSRDLGSNFFSID